VARARVTEFGAVDFRLLAEKSQHGRLQHRKKTPRRGVRSGGRLSSRCSASVYVGMATR
jgi:hypothetical protein